MFLIFIVSGCPDMCPAVWYEPLCGSDENTYSNACYLELIKCSEKPDLYVLYEGECISTV